MGARDSDPAPRGRIHAGNVPAIDENAARAWRQGAGKKVQQRGLAGAIRSHNPDCCFAPDDEIDIVENRQRAEAFAQSGAEKKRNVQVSRIRGFRHPVSTSA